MIRLLRSCPCAAGFGAATVGLALFLVPGAGTAADRPEVALERALGAGRMKEAAAAADSLLSRARRERRLGPLAEAELADSIGVLMFRVGSPEALETASPLFEHALKLRETARGPQDTLVAGSLGTLAALRDYQGQWAEAVELAQRALAIRLHHFGPDDVRVAKSRRQVGTFLYAVARYQEAEAELLRALATLERARPPEPATLVDLWNGLGEIQRARGEYERAERSFQSGLGVARAELAASDGIPPQLLNNLAGLYKDMERFDQAELLLLESLALIEAGAADSVALAIAHLNLAEVYRLQGREEEAAPRYERALSIARRALGGATPDLAPFLSQTAALYRDRGRFARAESLYAETRALLTRTVGREHPLYAETLDEVGALREARKDPAGAVRVGREALEIRRGLLGADHPEVARTYVNLARWSRGATGVTDADKERWIDQALAILDASRAYPEARVEARAQRARRQAARGDLQAAIGELTVALHDVDTLRARRGGGDQARVRFLAAQADLFDLMVGWKLAAGDLEGAFEAHERARSRLLLDQIAVAGVDLRAGIPAATLEPLERRERAARATIADVQRQTDEAMADPSLSPRERARRVARLHARRDSAAAEYGRTLALIKEQSPVWRQVLSNEGRIASLAEVRKALVPADGILLEYHVGRDSSYLFVVPPEPEKPSACLLRWDSEILDRISSSQLRRFSNQVAANVATPGRGIGGVAKGEIPPRPGAHEGDHDAIVDRLLAVLVPEAVWKQVRRARVAIVIPDGGLQQLPFESLITARGADGVRYWLDDGPALSYGSSATSLVRLAERRRHGSAAKGTPVLSVSNPRFRAPLVQKGGGARPPGSVWDPLPGTAAEAARVSKAFPAGAVDVLEGAGATERRVREAVAARRFLHFATHGFVTETHSELLAGLVLAAPDSIRTPDDDGLLQLFEIYELPLTCELAVLSACETHRGPRVGGEGVFALSRGFLAAGSERVVATLWSIPDAPTADLVGSFFDTLAGGQPGPAAGYAVALRDAKRSIRRQDKWADPLYWAAPVLSGPL